jgi:hypothetical protein
MPASVLRAVNPARSRGSKLVRPRATATTPPGADLAARLRAFQLALLRRVEQPETFEDIVGEAWAVVSADLSCPGALRRLLAPAAVALDNALQLKRAEALMYQVKDAGKNGVKAATVMNAEVHMSGVSR